MAVQPRSSECRAPLVSLPLVQPDSPATQQPALLPVHTHNLPAPVTSLVGRQREIADIRVALCDPDIRLLTLTGPPGVGKTRLALRAAEELAEDFSDGVRFVPLADIRGDDLFLSALALALDVRAATDCPLLDRLREHLSTRKILLLLDNCEQLEFACRTHRGSSRLRTRSEDSCHQPHTPARLW